MPTPLTPYQWLTTLDKRATQKPKGLPRQDKVLTLWRGLAYRLGDALLVTTLTDIREVLYCPSPMARVPGAKTWIKGIANLRGQLVPVIDVQACLQAKPLIPHKRNRLLIINQTGIHAGILVEEVIGLKHFPEHALDTDTPCKEQWLAPFAKGFFKIEGKTWTVLDIHTLTQSDTFLKVAI